MGVVTSRHRRRAVGSVLVVWIGLSACSGAPAATTGPTTTARSAEAQSSQAPSPSRSATVMLTDARWTEAAPLPVGVSEVGVALVGRRIHVLGGYVAGRAHSTIQDRK